MRIHLVFFHLIFIPSLSEWLTHQHRDTLASIVGHPSLTSYLAIADGEATGRIKFEMTEVPYFNMLCTQHKLTGDTENASAMRTSPRKG